MRTFVLIGLALLVGTLATEAHPNLQNAMWVQFEPALVRVAVNASVKEIAVAQGAALADATVPDAMRLQRAAERHSDYLSQHLSLVAGTTALNASLIKLTPPPLIAEPEATFYQYEFEYPLTTERPAEVRLFHDMLKEWSYAAGTPWNVSYVVRAKRSDANGVTSWLLRAQESTTIPTGWAAAATPRDEVATPDAGRAFREYLRHGVLHILTGYDHLLFVAALVIATMSFWEMVKVIAAFTLAHTLTLALSVFGIFRLPAGVVEPVIAFSIVLVALENIFWPQRAQSRVRLAVAFGFGLIHGLGFAGGLLNAMQGLPSLGIWIALVAFSLGVEIGHQAVVLPLFGMLKPTRRKLRQGIRPPMLRFASSAITCCGAYYLVVALHTQFGSH